MKIFKEFQRHSLEKGAYERQLACLEKIVLRTGLRKTLNLLSCSNIREHSDSMRNPEEISRLNKSMISSKQRFISFFQSLANEGSIDDGILKEISELYPIFKSELSSIVISPRDSENKSSATNRIRYTLSSHDSPETLTFNDFEIFQVPSQDNSAKKSNLLVLN